MSYFIRVVRFPRPDQPQPVYTGALTLWEAFTYPPISDAQRTGTVRTPASPRFDVRFCDASPSFTWVNPVVDGAVSKWAAAFVPLSARVGSRPSLDVRGAEWSPQPAWIFTASTPIVTTAQQWPAILANLGLSYRAGDRSRLDVRGAEWSPEDGWRQRLVDSIVSTWVPAFASTGGRCAERLPWRTDPQPAPAWIFSVVPTSTVAQQWPAVLLALQPGYRSVDRARLDVRGAEWSPENGWLQRVVESVVSTWAPIFDAELGFRSTARASLDVHDYQWAPDASGWIYPVLPVVASTAQQWPAMLQALAPGYRSEERARLDVRRYEWSPAFSWPARVVDAIVAKWQPIFAAELGYRSGARPPIDVRDSSWSPELAWLISILTIIAPTADVVVCMRADDAVILMAADDVVLVVTPDDMTVALQPDDAALILPPDDEVIE